MEKSIQKIRQLIPDYAKDIRLNLDSMLARSSLEDTDAAGVALAAAFASESPLLITAIREAQVLPEQEITAVLTAASLMAMNNIWYPYPESTGNADLKGQPTGLRMNAYANYGGTERRRFEMYALSASIVGKCDFCIRSHFDLLLKEGMSITQLADIGRIAATIHAAARVIAAEQH